MIIREAPREHLGWLAERADLTIGPTFRAMEVLDGDRIAGMVGFDGWTEGSCCAHFAIDDPRAALQLIRHAFRFAFVTCGRLVIIGTVLSNNPHALEVDRRLGFREVFRGRDWWAPGVDLIWLEMRREDCRWLERKAA